MDFDERSERVFQRYGPEKELSWEAALRIFGDHAGVLQEQAAGGDGRFLYFLGTYHERGAGMPRDLDAARTCYEKAAAAGERKAMLRLAHLYFTGQGVERDENKARKWRDAGRVE